MSTQLDAPVLELIAEALKWGLFNRINPQDGYYNDMDNGEVNLMEKSWSERSEFPSIDIIFPLGRMTNTIAGGNSIGGFNHIQPVLIEGWLQKSENAYSDQLRLKADIEKYFGEYFKIEDRNGNATAFNSVIESSKLFGMKQNQPSVGVDTRVLIYYRTEQANPAQSF